MTETVKAIVRRAMEEADRQNPGRHEMGVALARLLEAELGYPVKHKTVQSWARPRGIHAISAQVVLASAKVTGISIDEYLRQETIEGRLARMEAQLRELLDERVASTAEEER